MCVIFYTRAHVEDIRHLSRYAHIRLSDDRVDNCATNLPSDKFGNVENVPHDKCAPFSCDYLPKTLAKIDTPCANCDMKETYI